MQMDVMLKSPACAYTTQFYFKLPDSKNYSVGDKLYLNDVLVASINTDGKWEPEEQFKPKPLQLPFKVKMTINHMPDRGM